MTHRVFMTISLLLSLPLCQAAGVRFEKQILSDRYYCDGVTSGDLNRDGNPDVVAGPFWYAGPDFKTARALYDPVEFPKEPSPTDSMFSFVHDFNGDGWPDVLKLGRVHKHQAMWFENPGDGGEKWEPHFAVHRVQGESPTLVDVDGDGVPELLAHDGKQWGFHRPVPGAPTKPWTFHPVSAAAEYPQFYHGEGLGDVNGDGRLDLILNEAILLQPGDAASMWARHDFKFGGKGGAQIFAFDADGDGDNDVVSALDAHFWGLAWFENIGARERLDFRRHLIMGERKDEATYGVAFSQPHALDVGDINGDGLRDIVTGKRMWAHGPKGDVEPNEAAVVYWFECVREDGRTRFVPHLIDDQSGVGVQIRVADVDQDARPDVLTASKLGAFLFRQIPD
jgi:hypothetical protein